jgi:hypothetical protein
MDPWVAFASRWFSKDDRETIDSETGLKELLNGSKASKGVQEDSYPATKCTRKIGAQYGDVSQRGNAERYCWSRPCPECLHGFGRYKEVAENDSRMRSRGKAK